MRRGARRAAVAVAMGSVVGLVAPGHAAADPEAPATYASMEAGACGWWWKETAQKVLSVSVCGTEGLSSPREPGQLVQQVVVDWYSCPRDGSPSCLSQHHEGKVTRRELVLDPLLRMAGIHTVFGSCAVDLWFSGTSEPKPEGGLAAFHSVGAAPGLSFDAGQTVSRPALWTGQVCGVDLVDGSGSGATLWRGAHGFAWFGSEPAPGHEE